MHWSTILRRISLEIYLIKISKFATAYRTTMRSLMIYKWQQMFWQYHYLEISGWKKLSEAQKQKLASLFYKMDGFSPSGFHKKLAVISFDKFAHPVILWLSYSPSINKIIWKVTRKIFYCYVKRNCNEKIKWKAKSKLITI